MKNSIYTKFVTHVTILLVLFFAVIYFFSSSLIIFDKINDERELSHNISRSTLKLDGYLINLSGILDRYINNPLPEDRTLFSELRKLQIEEKDKLKTYLQGELLNSVFVEYSNLLDKRIEYADIIFQESDSGKDLTYLSGVKKVRDSFDAEARQKLISIEDLQESNLDNNVVSLQADKSNNYKILSVLIILMIIFVLYSVWSIKVDLITPISKISKLLASGQNFPTNAPPSINKNSQVLDLYNTVQQTVSNLRNLNSSQVQELKDTRIQLETVSETNKNLETIKLAVVNILEDLDKEKKNVGIEKDKLNTIIQSMGDAVFALDKDYKIVSFNHICSDLSGYTAEEAIGKRYDEVLKFVKEGDMSIADSFIKDSLEKGLVSKMDKNTLLVDKFGEKFPVADSASPIKDGEGNIIGCVVVFRDVTTERAVDRSKTEFVSLASHQLRTPLSSINWYSEMLLNEDTGKLTQEQKDMLNEIRGSNQRMIDLIESLLNVSRIDLGTFAISPVPTDLVEMAKSIVKDINITAKDRGIVVEEIYPESLPIMNLDPNLTRIIIENLLTNAVKYNKDKGMVKLSIELKGEEVLITVQDNGIGIPKIQQNKIFNKLFRADNVSNSDVSGTGLGLYIIKSILDSGGGKVWFESEENVGSTFHISLPLSGMTKKEGTKGLS